MTDALIVNRTIQEHQEETVKRTQVTSQRLLDNRNLPPIEETKSPSVQSSVSHYSVDYGPKTVDLPIEEEDTETGKLISRKKTEHTTQEITTTTKVIRELHRIGPNGEVLSEESIEYHPDYLPPVPPPGSQHSGYAMDPYRPHSPTSDAGSRGPYEGYAHPPNQGYNYDPYSHGAHTEPQEFYGYQPTATQGDAYPPEQYREPADYPPRSGYAELDTGLIAPNGQEYRNTPSPGVHGTNPRLNIDPSYDGENYIGDYPDEGGFRGSGRRREVNYSKDGDSFPMGGFRPPSKDMDPYHMNEAEIYGSLRQQPPRPPSLPHGYIANGIPLQGHSFEEDPLLQSRTPPAITPVLPSPQASIPTGPSTPLPQLTLNHDTYAPPSLLRSPSADSTSRVRWRDPDLHEVIDFLSNPNPIVKANAAAYLQHLCYMDDAIKHKTRILGGIPPLLALLSQEVPELQRNACGALRNLSYGRQNDENKLSIKDAGGIPTLVRLLRKTRDNEVKEFVTGILWNLSSCEELKQIILDEALSVLVNHIIIPCSGWDGGEVERDPNADVWWTVVFKNASGSIRNMSSAGEYSRTRLRQCPGLIESLFCVLKLAIQGNSHDNKGVENCVCILRNLSYRCQEVEDPHYDRNQPVVQNRSTATVKGDNLGCFGGSRRKKDIGGLDSLGGTLSSKDNSGVMSHRTGSSHRSGAARGMEMLWQPDLVVGPYLSLLSDCSNPETLEAAAGALQNLSACYWQPSIDVRAAVRKEKGLPILVELLRMEVDRVVCAVATALRNLAIDQRNKELIGKYAMRDLVQKLPSQSTHDGGTSDDTIAAVLATLNEVIKKNAEFSRSLLDAGGVDRLVYITKQKGRYSSRVVKFASQVLFSLWAHQELREVYRKAGWKEPDFVSKSMAAKSSSAPGVGGSGAHSPTANNTLNRPMASQGGTRYEDRTIQRSHAKQGQPMQYQRQEDIPMNDMQYDQAGQRISGRQAKPYEPVYAQVNRDKKRQRPFDQGIYGGLGGASEEWGDPPAYSALPNQPNAPTPQQPPTNNNDIIHMEGGEPAGDSWV